MNKYSKVRVNVVEITSDFAILTAKHDLLQNAWHKL